MTLNGVIRQYTEKSVTSYTKRRMIKFMEKFGELVRERREALKMSQVELAKAVGTSQATIDKIENERSIRSRFLPFIFEVLGLPLDDLTKVKITPPKPNASFPPRYQQFSQTRSIPVYGQTEAGPNGRFIMNGMKVADVFCPPGLEEVPEAYAVRVYGTSMEPRFKAGETVWLNPRLPVRAGDDVVVQLKAKNDGDEIASYIKEFRSRSSKVLRLFQHNPEEGEPKDLEFDSDDVFSIHKVVHHSTI